MNKKYIKIGILSILSLVIIYFIVFAVQNYTLTNSFSKETNTIFNEDTQFVRCNLNILKPEFAFVYGLNISFENSKNLFYQTEEKWDKNYTGGTTISNTTFPQLLAMVKEDCSQFQINGKKEDVTWIYMKYNREMEKQREIERKIKEQEVLERIKNEKPMTDEEIKKDLEERERLWKELEKELLQESQ